MRRREECGGGVEENNNEGYNANNEGIELSSMNFSLYNKNRNNLIAEYANAFKASGYGERAPNNDEFKKRGLTNYDIQKAIQMVKNEQF